MHEMQIKHRLMEKKHLLTELFVFFRANHIPQPSTHCVPIISPKGFYVKRNIVCKWNLPMEAATHKKACCNWPPRRQKQERKKHDKKKIR